MSQTKTSTGAWRLWLQLWQDLARGDKTRLIWALMAMVIGSLLTASVPVIVGKFVDDVVEGGQVVGLANAVQPLVLLVGAMLIISIMELVRHQLVHKVTTSFQASMRQRIYAALIRWPLARYVQGAKGAIYGRANRSVEGAERLIKLGAADLLPAVMVSAFAIGLALINYSWVGAIMAIVVPTGFALVQWQIRSQKGIRVLVVRAKESIDGDVSAVLGLLPVIRTTGSEEYFDGRVNRECDDLRDVELKHHIAMSKFDMAKAVNEAVWLIVTMAAALSSTSVSPGDLAGIVLLYFAITKPLRELHRVLDEGSESALQARDLQEDLTRPLDPSYFPSPLTPSQAPRSFAAVRARDLTFAYDDRLVLDALSLEVPEGQTLGIVGPSGCGKSTLLSLVASLTHGYTGDIHLWGRRLDTIPRDERVELLGYVPQKAQLFAGTVRENITMGRPDISEEMILDACRRANIHDEIAALPHGYESRIGEEGARLSGGQQQRLCLARALVRTPRLLLLDEPTSALDGPSQAVVQSAIDELTDATVLIVAHRLSTLRTTDRIIVMIDGKIIEDGSYDELAARDGHFTQMLESERRAEVGGLNARA
jgi:ATP-binding cassette subfamily B protein